MNDTSGEDEAGVKEIKAKPYLFPKQTLRKWAVTTGVVVFRNTADIQ